MVTGLQFMGILEVVAEVLRYCRPLLLPIGITVWEGANQYQSHQYRLFGKLII